VPQESTVNLAVSVKSGSATTALVDVELYDQDGAKVHQQVYDNQTFAAGQTRTFTPTWRVPAGAATGTYTVKVGVFKPGWGVLYHWNNSAAQFAVTP
jgi:hypothetical protein